MSPPRSRGRPGRPRARTQHAARTMTKTRSPATRCVTTTLRICAASGSRAAVEADRMARAGEALAGRAALDEPVHAGPDGELHRRRRERLARRDRTVRGGEALPAAGRRDAADVRTERGGAGDREDAGEEDGGRRGGDAGIDGAAERAAEGDVDVPAAQLGVESGDDEPLRARELVPDLRRAGGDDPRACHGDADLQPAALVRRARAGGRRRRDRARRREDRSPSHGTLLSRSADSAPPASSSTSAPPAKRSVTSRCSVLWPMRVARCR